jgi:asparagine synthase (glutamine-hydrolysing)
MCGIIGTLSRDHKNPKIDQWNLDQIAHRGPDGRGVYSDEYLSFGHTRLSIIDLSETGHQPMEYADSRYVITYNGEIYNYLELRKDLEEIGEHFISNSDTEVILGAYHIWGKKCVNKFRGMFAFAIWDKKKKTLFLARDRCGEKPLLYWQNKDVFFFHLNIKVLFLSFLKNQY